MRLSVQNISKSYKKNKALQNFTVDFEPGIYALLGPNGSGKTTLMNIMTNNLTSDSGEITYGDDNCMENILTMGKRFREKIGYMPQYPGLYPNFTVSRFLWYMATLKEVGNHLEGRERHRYVEREIEEILSEVELSDVSYRKIRTLSGGMKQRLCLAQAVLGSPDILILDEPTAGLDPKQRITVRKYISQIAFNKIVIIATHVVSDIEYIAKEIIMLKKGIVVDKASPGELMERMKGKVWQLEASDSEAESLQREYCVINILKEDSKKVLLRIIADENPCRKAVSVTPTLEDYYLYIFGNEGAGAESLNKS